MFNSGEQRVGDMLERQSFEKYFQDIENLEDMKVKT